MLTSTASGSKNATQVFQIGTRTNKNMAGAAHTSYLVSRSLRGLIANAISTETQLGLTVNCFLLQQSDLCQTPW